MPKTNQTLLLCVWLLAALLPVPSQAAPTHYKVGAYVLALHDFSPVNGTFGADFWVWSIGPDPKRQPLQTMEFVNANRADGSLDTTTPRGKAFWETRKITGTFRHDWNLQNYPFDRQTLEIRMEEAADDATVLVYDPDLVNTAYSPEMRLDDWRITGFRAEGGQSHYGSTFGDPALAPRSGSDYSRVSLFVSLARTNHTGFFKLTAAAYAAFLLAFISFLLNPDLPATLGARLSLVAGSLFAAVVSMRSASTMLASDNGLTLIDKIHISVLVYIIGAALAAVLTRLYLDRGGDLARVRKLTTYGCITLTLLFAAANLELVLAAAAAG